MIPKLTKQQISLLRDLSRNPIWMSLLDDLDGAVEIRPYKLSSNDSEEAKHARFIWESGAKFHNKDILTILRLNHLQTKDMRQDDE